MKITNVEVLVLKSPGLYRNPETSEEPPGPTYMGLVKVSTDAGITGYSDMETAAPVAKAAVEAPRWSEGDIQVFDGLASLLVGENPLEVERLWYRMYRGQHLLRPARRGDAGDLGDRHRAVGHHGEGVRPADPRAARRQVARQGARLREHAVPADARRRCARRQHATSTRASPR